MSTAFAARVKKTAHSSNKLSLIQDEVKFRTFSCREAAECVKLCTFSSTMAEAVEAFAPALSDPENGHLIVDVMKFSSDKENAREILAQHRPKREEQRYEQPGASAPIGVHFTVSDSPHNRRQSRELREERRLRQQQEAELERQRKEKQELEAELEKNKRGASGLSKEEIDLIKSDPVMRDHYIEQSKREEAMAQNMMGGMMGMMGGMMGGAPGGGASPFGMDPMAQMSGMMGNMGLGGMPMGGAGMPMGGAGMPMPGGMGDMGGGGGYNPYGAPPSTQPAGQSAPPPYAEQVEGGEGKDGESLASVFKSLKMDKYLSVFEENEIELEDLPELSADEIKDMVPALGPRKRLLKYIKGME